MLNLTADELTLIAEKRDILNYKDFSRKQWKVSFSDKHSPETLNLDSLLKRYKQKYSV